MDRSMSRQIIRAIINTKTNLARCFRCKRNFNPIDMTMTVKRYSFIQAVRFLEPILEHVLAYAENRNPICAKRDRRYA